MPPELSIIVPVYNEERTLADVMMRLREVCSNAQIIYVDDGSKDESLRMMKEHAREGVDIVLTKQNGGKGSAIRLGIASATGIYTTIQDADLEYDPAEISLLVQKAKEYPGSVVFGSRFLKKNPNVYKLYLLGNKVLTGILNFLFGAHLTDSYTCYKLMKTDAFRSLQLESRGFELEAEITCMCLKKKMSIIEVPISYKPRTLEEGKKIGWKDAWKGVRMMLRIRLRKD